MTPRHTTHRYPVSCSWSGSTGRGYEHYSRAHLGQAAAGATLQMSADQAFRGDPELFNPERLLVLAAASCQMLSFLAVAARAGLDVRHYQDDAEAVLETNGHGGGRITEVTLRPRLVVLTTASEERLRQLTELAHEQCFIAATLNCPITIEPFFDIHSPYGFGDSSPAARRLALLADLFAPTSRAFLAAHSPTRATLAVDLGCGPGHTTGLVADVTAATTTVGLDVSVPFLTAARADAATASTATGTGTGTGTGPGRAGAPAVRFVEHDARLVPFPEPARAADVIYARLLLAHLVDVEAVVADWCDQLSADPSSVLLLEEAESMDTDQPAMRAYLDYAERVLAARGATSCAGSRLTAAAAAVQHRGIVVVADTVITVSPPVAVAAEMFALNLAAWRSDPLLHAEQADLDRLADELAALAAPTTSSVASATGGHITWRMRQLALRRRI